MTASFCEALIGLSPPAPTEAPGSTTTVAAGEADGAVAPDPRGDDPADDGPDGDTDGAEVAISGGPDDGDGDDLPAGAVVAAVAALGLAGAASGVAARRLRGSR